MSNATQQPRISVETLLPWISVDALRGVLKTQGLLPLDAALERSIGEALRQIVSFELSRDELDKLYQSWARRHWFRDNKFRLSDVDLQQETKAALYFKASYTREARTVEGAQEPFTGQLLGGSPEDIWARSLPLDTTAGVERWFRTGSGVRLPCNQCQGNGSVECATCQAHGKLVVPCPMCGGRGQIVSTSSYRNAGDFFPSGYASHSTPCQTCQRSGKVVTTCGTCQGHGRHQCSQCVGSGACYHFEHIVSQITSEDSEVLLKPYDDLPLSAVRDCQWPAFSYQDAVQEQGEDAESANARYLRESFLVRTVPVTRVQFRVGTKPHRLFLLGRQLNFECNVPVSDGRKKFGCFFLILVLLALPTAWYFFF